LEIDPNGIKKAIVRLEKRCEGIGRFADKYIAHHDRKRGIPPNLDDVDKAIEAVGKLFNEASVLLTGRLFSSLEPTDVTGWEDVLSVAWIPQGSEDEAA